MPQSCLLNADKIVAIFFGKKIKTMQMKQKLSRLLLLLATVALISSTSPGCKSKPKDADVKSSVETALRANPETNEVMVDVKMAWLH